MRDFGSNDGQDVDPLSQVIWRGFTHLDQGAHADHPNSSAFVSAGDDFISVCVVDPDWPSDFVPDWIRADWGLAILTVGDLLTAGFARVIWAERQFDTDSKAEVLLEGHSHALYTGEGTGARRRQAKKASELSRFTRKATEP